MREQGAKLSIDIESARGCSAAHGARSRGRGYPHLDRARRSGADDSGTAGLGTGRTRALGSRRGGAAARQLWRSAERGWGWDSGRLWGRPERRPVRSGRLRAARGVRRLGGGRRGRGRGLGRRRRASAHRRYRAGRGGGRQLDRNALDRHARHRLGHRRDLGLGTRLVDRHRGLRVRDERGLRDGRGIRRGRRRERTQFVALRRERARCGPHDRRVMYDGRDARVRHGSGLLRGRGHRGGDGTPIERDDLGAAHVFARAFL